MMMVNTSETCATTKLIQCRSFGISMNDVSGKFMKSPDASPDLSEEEFKARKIVMGQVDAWCIANEEKPEMIYQNRWAPILYKYEIVKTSAKRERDWGHLVFTDMTLTRFLLVMIFPSACNCGNHSHHDYEALIKYQADRLMSLLKYLHHKEARPSWIRATYTTPSHQFKLDPVFLDSHDPPSGVQGESAQFPPIIHVTPDNFTPSLLPGDLEKIDNLLARRGGKDAPIPASVREAVIGSKQTRPDVSAAWKQRNPRQCAYCEKHGEKSLSICSRCKLVQYCGPECQKLAWPSHKLVCKKA